MRCNRPFLPLLAALGLSLAACSATRQPPREPAPLPRLVLLPFTIEPLPLEGAPSRSDPAGFAQILATEATSAAEQALIEHHVASAVERAAPGARDAGALQVTGVVKIPVTLPGDLIGLRADKQRGPLVVAVVHLLGPDGKAVQKGEAILTWRDAKWLEGAPRFRRNLPAEAVLREAVREAVEIAVDNLGPHPDQEAEGKPVHGTESH